MAGMNNGGLRGGNGRRGYRPMAEINVTPFVDVMLVLLIVFMVTAPLLTVGVPVDLPRTEAQNISEQDEPLVVSVTEAGVIYVQESEVEMANLVPLLIAVTDANPEAQIFIRGDRALLYGRIMEVMGAINAAGFQRVSLVAELPQEPAS
ncbi:MAG: protein TolR [Pseudomonadota bacterium]